MPGWQRSYLTASSFAIGFVLAYVVTDYFHLPRIFYDGVARRFLLARAAGPLAMGYIGLWTWGLLTGGVLAGLTALGSQFIKKELEPGVLHVVGGWALGLVAIGVAYFTWNNWPYA